MKVEVKTSILSKIDFNNTVDTTFRQLIDQTIQQTTVEEPTIDYFFQLYEDLFYAIPKQGEKSHNYLLNKSADYLGVNISTNNVQELLEEITTLNQQLLTTTQELESIKNVTISQ